MSNSQGIQTSMGTIGEVTHEELYKIFPKDITSGIIANFSDGAKDIPIDSFTVNLTPVQSLNGYDSPWPAGGGKNKLNLVSSEMTSDGWQRYFPFTIAEGTYTISAQNQFGANESYLGCEVYLLDESNNKIQDIAGGGGSYRFGNTNLSYPFTVTSEVAAQTVKINFAMRASGTTFSVFENAKIMVESGSSATAYAPYSNICPISGTSIVNIHRTGKNLLPKMTAGTYSGRGVQAIVDKNGVATLSGTSITKGTAFTIPLQSSITLTQDMINNGLYYHLNNTAVIPSSEACIESSNGSVSVHYVFTRPNNKPRVASIGSAKVGTPLTQVRFYVNATGEVFSGTYAPAFMFDSNTDTTYVPYAGNISLNINLNNTCYGGTLDVINGVLTVTHKKVMLPTTFTSWVINTNGRYTTLSALGIDDIKSASPTILRTSYCKMNALKASTIGWYSTAASLDPQFVISYDNYIMINIGVAAPTVAQTNQFISDNGLYIVYPMKTPQTYQLTPTEVKTLFGENNIWSDAGEVTVKYRADIQHFLQKLVQPSGSNMIMTENISSNKYFIIDNILYLSTTSIASGETIVPGTNCIQVSLADALNNLN